MSKRKNPPEPPRLAEALLRSRLPRHSSSLTILGDLREDYQEERTRRSRPGADAWYWGQALAIALRFADRRSRGGHTGNGPHAATARGYESLAGAFASDLRLAVHRVAGSPGFAAATILTLAAGIAGTVAMFSVLDAALLQSLPYPDADRLVLGRATFDGRLNATASYPDYIDYRDQSDVFESLSLIRSGMQSQTITGGEVPQRVDVNWVTVDMFETLGVEPLLGRRFTEDEAEPGSDWVVMITHGFWQRHFGGSPDAVGSTLVMDGFAHTVVGVTPPGFRFRHDADMWLPIRYGDMDTTGRSSHSWIIVGRLRPGVSLVTAQDQTDIISARLVQAYPDSHEGKAVNLTPLGEALAEAYRPGLLMLMSATGLLLLIACGNVAGLLVARAATRRGELSLRAAMGASRGRLLRQLLAESLLTAVIAGALGAIMALWLQRLLLTLMPLDLLGIRDIGLSGQMLGFAILLSVVTAVLFGVGPAIAASRTDPVGDLRTGTRSSADGQAGQLRAGMIVVQVALTAVLLSGSGLLLRSLSALGSVDVGFDTENLLTAGVTIPEEEYESPDSWLRLYETIIEDLEEEPGVASASFINMVPILHRYMDWAVWDSENPPLGSEDAPSAYSRTALPGYFETMGIPLVRGRDHSFDDAREGRRTIILSESLAEVLFHGQDPIGRSVSVFNSVTDPSRFVVIGVVAEIRMTALSEDPFPQMYFGFGTSGSPMMNLVARTESDPNVAASAVRSRIRERDPDILFSYVTTMEEIVAGSWWGNRLVSYAVTVFALFALLLALTGVYGVLAFQVASRTHEIGVRMALGADASHVVRSVLRTGLALVVAGVAIGIPVALGASPYLESQLFGVTSTDAVTYGTVLVIFLIVGAVACLVPALRALRIDPVHALCSE